MHFGCTISDTNIYVVISKMYVRHTTCCLLQHEDASVAMFDHMVRSNSLLPHFAQYDFDTNDLEFIKEQIAGPKDCADKKVCLYCLCPLTFKMYRRIAKA